MNIRNLSKYTEKPMPVDVQSVWNEPNNIRLVVPVRDFNGDYKTISVIVDKGELKRAIDEC